MDAVEDIKSRLAIEDVIGEYVQLKRSGRNYKGLSPFSNEKSPSFIVSPEKQIWHDFSSGRGGDMFSFIMEVEGLDFKTVLELLARKAGVDLAQYAGRHDGSNAKLKERLHDALEQATKFYQVQFSKNQVALEYIFKKRQFTKEVALMFKIGYSPNTGNALVTYLKKQGFSDEEMQKSGLTTKRYRDSNDMFRGRIMIPLMDAQGRAIGFTARILEDNPEAPKYINTPQTLLYDKSRHVFGLHLAKEAIRKSNYVVVAEGNLDVIASQQAGTKHVVATAGTAMTEYHLKALARFTQDIRIAFDQDAAGQAAAERAIPIASKLHLSLGIITIPDGKDPDELIRKNPKQWEKTIENKQYAVDWLIERYTKSMDLGSADNKRRFSDTLLTTIRQLEDPVEQDHYLQQLAGILEVSADALRAKLQATSPQKSRLKRSNIQPVQSNAERTEHIKMQDHLLSLVLHRTALRDYLKPVTDDMMLSEEAKTLLAFIKENPEFDPQSKQATGLQTIADYVKIIRLQYETLYQELDELELEYEAARLQTRLISHYVKTKKKAITQELLSADETRTKDLLEKARALDLLRKKIS